MAGSGKTLIYSLKRWLAITRRVRCSQRALIILVLALKSRLGLLVILPILGPLLVLSLGR